MLYSILYTIYFPYANIKFFVSYEDYHGPNFNEVKTGTGMCVEYTLAYVWTVTKQTARPTSH